jgi:hypothetical protein
VKGELQWRRAERAPKGFSWRTFFFKFTSPEKTFKAAQCQDTYHPNEKSNMIADCLENQFTSHDLCDENHERWVETRVQAQLASVDDTTLEKVR